MSPCLERRMTTGGDTSDGRCEDHDMSPCSDHHMTTGGDTSDRRCVGLDRSPITECPRANVMDGYKWTSV
jgi:hypothetical protein